MKLSVIIPVYNSEKYLSECVDSVLSQDFDSFELILVDDGSTDKSGSICDEYRKNDDRVRVYHTENRGRSRARNFGIEKAIGEYLFMPDSDDIILPHAFEKLVGTAESTKARCVCCGYSRLFLSGERKDFPQSSDFEFYLDNRAVRENILPRLLGSENKGINPFFQSACNKLYLKSALKESGAEFLPVKEYFTEDFIFNFSFFLSAGPVVVLPDIFYLYRYNPSSTSSVYDPDRTQGVFNMYNLLSKREYIKESEERQRMLASNVMGLVSVEFKYAAAGEDGYVEFSRLFSDKRLRSIACACRIKEIKFPLSLFVFLIKHRLKNFLYLLVKIYLAMGG